MSETNLDLWAAYTALPRPHSLIDLPRKDVDGNSVGQVACWILTQQETEVSQAEAGKYVREVLKMQDGKNESDHAYIEVYNNELAVQLLIRALRQPGNLNIPFCPNAKEFRSKVSLDETAVLFNEYILVRRKLGPIVSEMSEPEMEALLKRLSDGGERSGLGFFSSVLLTDLLCFSASLIASLRMHILSPGLPPDDTTTA